MADKELKQFQGVNLPQADNPVYRSNQTSAVPRMPGRPLRGMSYKGVPTPLEAQPDRTPTQGRSANSYYANGGVDPMVKPAATLNKTQPTPLIVKTKADIKPTLIEAIELVNDDVYPVRLAFTNRSLADDARGLLDRFIVAKKISTIRSNNIVFGLLTDTEEAEPAEPPKANTAKPVKKMEEETEEPEEEALEATEEPDDEPIDEPDADDDTENYVEDEDEGDD